MFAWSTLSASPDVSAPISRPSRLLAGAVSLVSALMLVSGSALAAGESQARLEAAPCEAPEFPTRWQEDGDSGIVTLAVLVAEDGKVMASRLLNSSGIARFDRASLKASARCKFQPAAKDKQSMPSWMKVQYNWQVE